MGLLIHYLYSIVLYNCVKIGEKMIIGLVRHFKVDLPHSRFMTSIDFMKWAHHYDIADVIENAVEMGDIEWNKCYSSDLPRAVRTAETIYDGQIIKTQLLREVPMSSPFNTKLKLPYVFWGVFARIAWLFSHKSQEERRIQTKKRIREFLDLVKDDDSSNILVVCHGFFMYIFEKELKRQGFKGRRTRRIKNGTMYVFEK